MRYLPLLQALITRHVPVYVHYGVTHRCNLSCRMCGIWKIANKEQELNIGQIRQMARNLRRLGTCAISLGGGEPFVRQDLPEIIRAFQEQDIEPRVLTNGLIRDRALISRVLETGIRHISISLDTPNSALQDSICNREGSWEGIIDAIRFWGEALRPRHGLGLINCVVSELNLKELETVQKIAKYYGFKVSYVPVELHRYQEKDLGCSGSYSDMPFRPEDFPSLDAAVKRLIKLRRQWPSTLFNSTPYLKGMLSFLKNQPSHVKCYAGALSFSVSPEGIYSMCHLHKGCGDPSSPPVFAAGKDFVSWYRRTRPYRQALPVAANCQSCFRPCWREIALAFTNPEAFLQAASQRLPHRIPKHMPTVRELQELLQEQQ